MAFKLEREKTTSTPYVLIDEEKSCIKMEGKCFREKTAEFFKEITDWLDVYLATDFGTFTFDNAINYFNSSTTKLLLSVMLKMDDCSTPENKIVVNNLYRLAIIKYTRKIKTNFSCILESTCRLIGERQCES